MTMRCPTIAALCLYIPLCAAAATTGDRPTTSVFAPTGAVDAATAAIVAQHHVARYAVADDFRVASTQIVRADSTAATLCYCCDLSPAGYVIVSADAALPPVIAYSFSSPSPCDLTPGTPLADLLISDLQRRRIHADLLPAVVASDIRAAWAAMLAPAPATADRTFEQWPPPGTTPTGGWVETNWCQTAPYNNLCPMDLVAGARSVAGCPSLAMAQILDYNARLNATHLDDSDDYYHNYGGNQYWIDDAYVARGFPSFPQLNAHLDALFDNYFYGTAPTNTRIAALVFACGVAARQVYGASGSGTFGVDQAFRRLPAVRLRHRGPARRR